MSEILAIARLAEAVRSDGGRAVLAHLVSVEGSHYRRPGARMLLAEDGRSAGSMSGGCLEADLFARVPDVLARGQSVAVDYDMRAPEDLVWGLGLGCDGAVRILLTPLTEERAAFLDELARAARERRTIAVATVTRTTACGPPLGAETRCDPREPRIAFPYGTEALVEVLEPPILLAVCGTGPDASPLVRLAREIGWSVEVASFVPRSTAALRMSRLLGIDVRDPAALPSLAERGAAVVMTHSFPRDLEALRALLDDPPAYLGVLGPRARTERLLAALRGERALPPDLERRLHAPAGLDIGAETPEEIALSIVSEVKAALAGRSGGRLRQARGPIHERPAEAGPLRVRTGSRSS